MESLRIHEHLKMIVGTTILKKGGSVALLHARGMKLDGGVMRLPGNGC